MSFSREELFTFLEEKYNQYNTKTFIETDPVSIPHQFTLKEDIEISGFLTATLSWGNRVSIIKAAMELVERMDNSPYQFLKDASSNDLKAFHSFYYRTFNGADCLFFMESLRNIYLKHGGLENCFSPLETCGLKETIGKFRKLFLETAHPSRSEKHISDPFKGSSCKRLNLFLRWMVRKDDRGVDFGIWNSIPISMLLCPLDIHSGNVARKLGLLNRKQNDWQAAEELTEQLRSFSPEDPVKYDFALFGLGIFEKF